jgi:hypothetical protein
MAYMIDHLPSKLQKTKEKRVFIEQKREQESSKHFYDHLKCSADVVCTQACMHMCVCTCMSIGIMYTPVCVCAHMHECRYHVHTHLCVCTCMSVGIIYTPICVCAHA